MEINIAKLTENMFCQQLEKWELARNNFAQLAAVRSRQIEFNGLPVTLQFNAERIRSAAAKTDSASLKERRCFLCSENRPAEQESVDFINKYDILVNPFPIFKRHLTISSQKHVDQRIEGRYEDMIDLAKALPEYVVFYNGAKCGASAPDHMHFQAGNKGMIPIECAFDQLAEYKNSILEKEGTRLSELTHSLSRCLILESDNKEEMISLFYRILEGASGLKPEEPEPMMNLLCWYDEKTSKWTTIIYLRRAHRPRQFFAEGDENILISPASVEMGGLFVLALEKDYNKVTKNDLEDIMDQILITPNELNQVIQQL